jgi:hypothetical protein
MYKLIQVGAKLTCTAQPDTHEVLLNFLLYGYRDTVLLGAAKSPDFSPLITPPSIGSQDTRLRTTAVAVGGWKMGLGTDGIVNFDSPRGGNGPRTRRRGVGGGRRGMRGPDLF